MEGLLNLTISARIDDTISVGSYLSHLESLYMKCCDSTHGLPASLATATHLRHLDLELDNEGVNLTAPDVAMLSSLPALTILSREKPDHLRRRRVWGSVWLALHRVMRRMLSCKGLRAPGLQMKRMKSRFCGFERC